ncbi:MAG: DMT family transporter [Akkermansiaceae bacterium]|jgi:drug/metabolite transporter (DMT)-like permease|nr:DMT family transporter [Akkermansiaceae bacterium]
MPTLVQLHLLVVLLAATAIFGALSSLSAAVLVTWRTALAAFGALAFAALIRHRRIWPGWRSMAAMLGIGAIIGLHWLCFFGAIQLANVSICMAGMATISLFTAFSEPLINRRRFRPFEILLGLLVLLGILLIAGVEKQHLTGLGIALTGAMLASIFPVLNHRLVHRGGDPQTMVGWEMIGACLVCLTLLPLFDPGGHSALLRIQPMDWLWILLLAWLCTVFGHALHIRLLRKISAYQGNLAFNFEPVYGILGAGIVFGEWHHLHPAFYLGALTILAANLLHPWLERRSRRAHHAA